MCALALPLRQARKWRGSAPAIEKLRALVEAGAVPRAQLEREEARLADAADADLLRATLYGPDLTEDQTGGMIAAAGRRWDRRKQELAQARKLVEEGVASQLSLGPYLERPGPRAQGVRPGGFARPAVPRTDRDRAPRAGT